MCGIAGILDFGHQTDFDGNSALNRMLDSLGHRGPDDRGEERIDGSQGIRLWLGHQRLSIIDLSNLGHQPMANNTGSHWISCNGEIYNFRELRSELESRFKFQSQSDTEVLLKAYEAWGVACLKRLRGMFAFGIWDDSKQELFLARDRLGVKPLYFYYDQYRFIFASEIRSLANSKLIPKKLNTDGIFDYLSFGRLQGPHSILEGIQELKPGHYMVVKKNQLPPLSTEYWNPIEIHTFQGNESQLRDQIQETLLQAVHYRLVSDVPVGTFLSGGIDSSALASLLSSLSKNSIKTLSVIFQEKEFDESPYSSLVARALKTDHQTLMIEQDDLLEVLPSAVSAMDQPTIDGINTYLVSSMAKRSGLKVVLSGLGGDELFGGYDSFWDVPRLARWNERLNLLPDNLKKLVALLMQFFLPISDQSTKLISLMHSNFLGGHVYYLYRALFCFPILQILISDSEVLTNGFKRHLKSTCSDLEKLKNMDHTQKISWLELNHYMVNMLLRDSDSMSMAHGLELRVPFVDHKLVELLLSVPEKYKMKPGKPKALLTESLPIKIPEAVLFRKKMGFTLPFQNWLKTKLKSEMERVILTPVGELQDYLSEAAVHNIWNDFLNGKTSWSRPWSLYILKKWVDRNLS